MIFLDKCDKAFIGVQVFSDRAAQADIDAVYSMGLFDDISISPVSAEDSTIERPRVRASFL